MSNNILPPNTKMGPVHLTTSDLERSILYYRRAIGLTLLSRDGNTVYLGAGQRELLHLTEQADAVRVPRRTGLYHFALLVPSRRDLGDVLRNLIAKNAKLTGGADHLVSEALYLEDPDGNGIEIYRDLPHASWVKENGQIKMDTLPLDYEGILEEASGATSGSFQISSGTIMGHVHLHVANIDESITFYRDVIGFDLQLRLQQSAAFLSAGGYHHHIGINTWAGVGAPAPPDGAVGLRHFQIELPDKSDLTYLIGRLEAAHLSYESINEGLYVRDPSQNRLLFITS